ncbi:MAG: ABC transporter permease [Anaerolineae bacterium]|nr:ABC transporter permease [Anaerolineae bacterium]
MLTKLLAIAWKDIYVTFRDRNALLYMFAMPVALSAIIGLAFGTDPDVSIDPIPVAVANQDAGTALPGGEQWNLGQIYESVFIPAEAADPGNTAAQVDELTDAERTDDPAQARDQVNDGDLAALIQIPADFTEQAFQGNSAAVSVYWDSGRSIGPSVVLSIVNSVTYGANTVLLAQQVGPAYLTQLGTELDQDQSAITQATGRVMDAAMSVAQDTPIRLEQVNLQGETRAGDALQYFAPSMAILFMTFTMAAGATTILDEQNGWTLQRIITTPTPRWLFMAGKLLGTYVTGVVQMIILVGLTSLVAALMGRETSVWGDNIAGIALLILAVSFAATSLGLVIAALSQTPSQASTYSTVALFLLGMLGGSFIPIENLPAALDWLPKITLNYWGIQGFFDLSYENAALSAISTNLVVLAVMGVVLFMISTWRFNRRLEI